jgi:hypothetical protein
MKSTYIQYGVPSSWAKDIENKGIPASTFKSTFKKNFVEKYGIE